MNGGGKTTSNKPGFFDFAAQVGLTKHFRGIGATEELARLCHVGPDSYVLDVGCGVGVTPCFLAKRYGCRVVGVNIPAYREFVRRVGKSGPVPISLSEYFGYGMYVGRK